MITLRYQKFMKGGARRQSALARRRYAALGLSLRSRDVPLYKFFSTVMVFSFFRIRGDCSRVLDAEKEKQPDQALVTLLVILSEGLVTLLTRYHIDESCFILH